MVSKQLSDVEKVKLWHAIIVDYYFVIMQKSWINIKWDKKKKNKKIKKIKIYPPPLIDQQITFLLDGPRFS